MAELTFTADFSSPDVPREAEFLARAYLIAKEEKLPVDMDFDGELLNLRVTGGPEELYAVLKRLEAQGCRGDVLVEFFVKEERERFGFPTLEGIELETREWYSL